MPQPSDSKGAQGPAIGRDPRVDALRGLCLMLMMVFHLPANPFQRALRLPLGTVPVAETFVFLAGLVSGQYYGRLLRELGPAVTRARAWRRAGQIYLTHLGVFLLLWAAARGHRPLHALWRSTMPMPMSGDRRSLLLGALLLYQPTFLDILPMYCVFILLTPWALRLLDGRRALAVIGASVALWLLARLGVTGDLMRQLHLRPGFFSVLAWQLLFVSGLLAGHARLRGWRVPRWALLASLLLLAGYLCVRWLVPGPLRPWMSRSTLGPLRLAMFLALAGLVASALRAARPPGAQALAYLGRRSLEVYAFSVVVSYACVPFWSASPPVQAMLSAGIVASLYLPAWLKARATAGRHGVSRWRQQRKPAS